MNASKSYEEFLEVPLEAIYTNPYQPRKQFETSELNDLASSIRSVGLIHPPVVRRLPDGKYELLAGERRFRAAGIAGLTAIPVIVRSVDDVHSAQAALIENIQRVDLNPLEISKALNRMMVEFDWSQEELSHKVGKKRSTVANYLRLLTLPKNIQDALSKGLISMGHAKAILSTEGPEKQTLILTQILQDDLNVRQAEEAAKRIEEKDRKNELVYVERDIYLEHLADKIQQRLGTKVTLVGKGKGGRITIDYYNLDDLDRILNLLEVNK